MAGSRRVPRTLLAGTVALATLFAGSTSVTDPASDGWTAPVASRPGAPPQVVDDPGVAPAPQPSVPTPADPDPLDAELAAAGFEVPEGASVYAVRVKGGKGAPLSYESYEAGGGALAQDFWPASSIKLLAALGALDFIGSMGFTGGAVVTFEDGREGGAIRDIYRAAIRDSSNYDYDSLVKIAGVDRLNDHFLTAAKGFPVTSIAQSYGAVDLDSPGMTLTQGRRRIYVPPRTSKLPPKCEARNCSNLFELSESVRRVMLHDEIPPSERFNLHAGDVIVLKRHLGGTMGFFPEAVADTLGPGARIYGKPGDVLGLDCLDVALIESPEGQRVLLAATVPHSSGGCEALGTLATGVLKVLAG